MRVCLALTAAAFADALQSQRCAHGSAAVGQSWTTPGRHINAHFWKLIDPIVVACDLAPKYMRSAQRAASPQGSASISAKEPPPQSSMTSYAWVHLPNRFQFQLESSIDGNSAAPTRSAAAKREL